MSYVAPEVQLAVAHAIPDHDRVPDPLPHVIRALEERPDLADWLTECTARPDKEDT